MVSDKIDTKIDYEHSQFLRILETISNSDIYKGDTPELSYQHKIGHIQRVLLFSQIIAQNENFEKNRINILLTAVAFHDCGRKKDRDNGEHGVSSAKIVGEFFRKNINNPYGIKSNEVGIVQVPIEYHVVVDEIPGQVDRKKLEEMCNKYNVRKEDFEVVIQIAEILKDADALDRMRFVSGNNLDSRFLRTSTAKKQSMIDFSKKINEEYANQIINVNYYSEQNMSCNKVKLLHDIRHKLRKDGIYNKEIDVPLNIVKEIFNGSLLGKKYIENDICYSECEDEYER